MLDKLGKKSLLDIVGHKVDKLVHSSIQHFLCPTKTKYVRKNAFLFGFL